METVFEPKSHTIQFGRVSDAGRAYKGYAFIKYPTYTSDLRIVISPLFPNRETDLLMSNFGENVAVFKIALNTRKLPNWVTEDPNAFFVASKSLPHYHRRHVCFR